MQEEIQSFAVRSHRGVYPVRRMPVARALPAPALPSDRFVVDEQVRQLHPILVTLAPHQQTLAVTADEELKSLAGVTRILSWLLDSGFHRGGTLYVVGGGTVQDAAAFAASVLHRGVPWVFVPTTLLAQGDSCIGSKSSINHDGYKNQLGTFFPPAGVVVDDHFLTTLAPSEVRSGVGEMLHYAVVGGGQLFDDLDLALADGWDRLSTREMSALAMQAMAVKRDFVESDEFDTGVRRNLNFGHTFGHGLEFASGGRIPHGIAVAYGILLANDYAAQRGTLSPATRTRVERVVRSLVDGSELAQVSGQAVFRGMTKDKKRSDDQIELILIEDLGRPVRTRVPLDGHLELFIEDHLAAW